MKDNGNGTVIYTGEEGSNINELLQKLCNKNLWDKINDMEDR